MKLLGTRGIRTLCSAADSYRGPGGLSARDIMSKIHEAKARDAGVRQEHAAEIGRRAAEQRAAASKQDAAQRESATPVNLERLQAMSTSELVQLLVQRGIQFSDCYEHVDLLARARTTLGESRGKVARHHPAYQAAVPASRLRGAAVDRSSAERKDDL